MKVLKYIHYNWSPFGSICIKNSYEASGCKLGSTLPWNFEVGLSWCCVTVPMSGVARSGLISLWASWPLEERMGVF